MLRLLVVHELKWGCAAADCASYYTCQDEDLYMEQGSGAVWAETLICDMPQADGNYCSEPGRFLQSCVLQQSCLAVNHFAMWLPWS